MKGGGKRGIMRVGIEAGGREGLRRRGKRR